ncbi:MAG: winged helix-turn-helix domain-containing protein [Blastocatellia bacterium]|jgi:Tol biopolymer transport system component/DNA-binding winged helix-turn-helix (wHTH) protein
MGQNSGRIYEFGEFRLDVARHRLFHLKESVPIRRKTYEILLLLVESGGELVEKEKILDQVWNNLSVEENNLTQHIHKLRRILGDTTKDQEYILTVPGKGYIFIKSVQLVFDETTDGTDVTARPTSPPLSEYVPDGRESGEVGPRPSPFPSLWTRFRTPTLTLVGLILLGALAVAVSIKVEWWRQPAGEAANVPTLTTFVALPGLERHLDFSPDGRYLAFSSEGETRDNEDIYVKMIDQDVMWRVTSHPDRDSHVAWSPDGTQLAFLRNSGQYTKQYKLMVVPIRGGVEQEIGMVWGGLDWAPDGKYLAVSDYEGLGTATGLYLVSPDGRERRNLTTPPVSYFDTSPRFSPDGKRLAFVRWRVNSNADIFLLTMDTGESRQMTFDDKRVTDLRWASNGEEIYFVSNRKDSNRLWRLPVAGGEPVLMALAPTDLESIAIARATAAPDSSDGDLFAFTQAITDTVIDIFTASGAGSSLRRPKCTINSSRGDDTPRFSPDGSKIAFVSTRTGSEEIWIAESDCSNPSQLTRFNQLGVGSPRWSPNGEKIVFDRNVDGNTDIFTINANGTDLRQLTTDKAIENMPSWSANGEWIYFSSYKSAVSQIYRIPARGGEVVPVSLSRGREPIESSDGLSLYYTNSDRLWRKDLRSGREAMIPELAEVPIGRYWDISGSTIYYISQQTGENPIVRTLNLTNRRAEQLSELPGSLARWVPGLDFAPPENLLAVGYVANRFGDISLVRGLLR